MDKQEGLRLNDRISEGPYPPQMGCLRGTNNQRREAGSVATSSPVTGNRDAESAGGACVGRIRFPAGSQTLLRISQLFGPLVLAVGKSRSPTAILSSLPKGQPSPTGEFAEFHKVFSASPWRRLSLGTQRRPVGDL
jgi:hypothetical protein